MISDNIAYCKIHPGVGIARVGNSPEAFFIGPENPGAPAAVPAYKDESGRVKRQAARFRVYAYDASGAVLGEITADDAKITWHVELANKKASFTRFAGKYVDPTEGIRNPDVEGKARAGLDVTPGPRAITGRNRTGAAYRFEDSFRYADKKGRRGTADVTLGELRTDAAGRLLVLGGFGRSASVIPDNPVGNPATGTSRQPNNYANNVAWHDDTSDGPVTAEVEIGGRFLEVRGAAHVIVAPPDFAPDVLNVVTLYDVAREVWNPHAPSEIVFFRDVMPVLSRLAMLRWTNPTALRGHGPGRSADFLSPEMIRVLADPGPSAAPARRAVFKRVRNAANVPFFPNNTEGAASDGDVAMLRDGSARPAYAAIVTPEAQRQANETFMPIMAGDGGEPVMGDGTTWMTLLPSQFEAMRRWAEGDFVPGSPVRPAARFEDIAPADQPAALDRAALERCVGAPFYPGLEMTYISEDPSTWAEPFRLASSFGAGDVTKHMALPWQADFYECREHWWPATRPDAVATAADLAQVSTRMAADAPPGTLPMLLDGRVSWERGLRPDGDPPHDYDGDNDMVDLWHELGFVVPRQGKNGDVVFVETERAPFVGKNVAANHRDYFNRLLNIDQNQAFLPKAHALALDFLAQAEAMLKDPSFQKDNPLYTYFPYTKEAFDTRLEAIYDSLVQAGEQYDPATDPIFESRADAIYRVYQLAPFNQLDGAWLRNVTRTGPIDEVRSLLFSIWADEVGDGNPAMNHCNVYTTLMRDLGIFLPPIESEAYANDPNMLDSAYTVGVLELAISQFSEEFLPEILGMTLQLEWEVPGLVPTRKLFQSYGIDAHFYELHIGIDNAASGHGAKAKLAVELYLDAQRVAGGEKAVQEAWRRIWNGYIAFEFTGTLGQDMTDEIKRRRTEARRDALEQQVIAIIQAKKPYANRNHGEKRLGANPLNEWFDDPEGLLAELQRSGFIVPGQPEISPFFQLTSFEGPMFKVFTDDELRTWQDWTRSLAGGPAPSPEPHPGVAMAHVVDMLRERQAGTPGHGVLLLGPDPTSGERVARPLSFWFEKPVDETSKGAVSPSTVRLMAVLRERENGWVTPFDAAQSPLVTRMASGTGPMAQALRAIMPGTVDQTYRDVIVTWIGAGCPLPSEEITRAPRHLRAMVEAVAPAEQKKILGKLFLH